MTNQVPDGTASVGLPAATAGQYSRKASGLIRTASVLDVFGLDVTNGLLGVAIAWMLLYIPWLYAGANIYLVMVIGTLLTVPLIMTFTKLAVIFPRSGGEYIYNSRLIHPAIGFAGSVGFVGMFMFWVGSGATYFIGYGIGPMLTTAGVQLDSQGLIDAGSWLSGTWQLVGVCLVAVALFGVLLIVGGMKAYFRFQLVAIVVGTLALLVIILYGFFASRTSALANAEPVIAQLGVKNASQLATGGTPAFSMWQTWLSQLWPWSFLPAAAFAVYVGGEVKQPARNLMRGNLAGLLFMAVVTMLAVGAMFSLFGQAFFANLANAFDTSSFGVASMPTYAQLTAAAIGNGYFTILLMVSFSFWGLMLSGAMMVFASRSIFAWGLDRVVPVWFSHVNSRWHSPQNALIVTMLGGAVFVIANALGWITPLYYNWAAMLAWLLIGISAIVVPYRMRALWASSPGARRIGGVPTITIWGVLHVAVIVFYIVLNFLDSNGGTSPIHYFKQFIVWPIVIGLAIVVYFISRSLRQRQGIDLALNFREIPPE
jgi:amino acid transporter